jgi:hypothetical protein
VKTPEHSLAHVHATELLPPSQVAETCPALPISFNMDVLEKKKKGIFSQSKK